MNRAALREAGSAAVAWCTARDHQFEQQRQLHNTVGDPGREFYRALGTARRIETNALRRACDAATGTK